MEEVAIIGATGNIGRASLSALAGMGRGRFVRASSRRPEAARKGSPAAAIRWQQFDFEQPESHAPFLEGVEVLFFIAPHDDPVPSALHLIETARQTGVRRIVYSSGRTTGDVPGRPMYLIEAAVRDSGLDWTILRPGWFMQNFTGWFLPSILEQHAIVLPAASARTAFVDVRDIGEVVARVLIEEGHARTLYELTGDNAYDHYEVAARIAEASGRPVQYRPVTDDVFRAVARSWGWTGAAVREAIDLYERVRSGKEATPSPDVRQLLGRPARTLANFIREHASVWKPN